MVHRKLWIVGAMVVLACIFLLLAFIRTRMPLVAISSDPNIHVSSVVCTVGTNHVYYHGDGMDRLMDPLISRLSDPNAYRLRCATTGSNTIVWVRFDHPDYGVIPAQGPPVPPPVAPFRAQLIDTTGSVVPLSSVDVRLQHYRRRFLVMGWEIAGQLKDHRGSTLLIEAKNGTGAVSFKVP
jgi:hypothetical protein